MLEFKLKFIFVQRELNGEREADIARITEFLSEVDDLRIDSEIVNELFVRMSESYFGKKEILVRKDLFRQNERF